MFSLQAPAIKQRVRGAKSFDDLADILSGILGDCQQPLEWNGPMTLNGPATFNGPVQQGGEGSDPTTAGMPVRGVLLDDLVRDGFARLRIDGGPVVQVFGYLVKDGSPAQKVIATSRVVAARCWGDDFFTAISGDNCTEDV